MDEGAGREDRQMKDTAEAKEWLTENLTNRSSEHSPYYAGLLEYIGRLPTTIRS